MNNSLSVLRRSRLLDSLDRCQSDKQKINILVEQVLQLQNSLIELQQNYCELLLNVKSMSCVQVPF